MEEMRDAIHSFILPMVRTHPSLGRGIRLCKDLVAHPSSDGWQSCNVPVGGRLVVMFGDKVVMWRRINPSDPCLFADRPLQIGASCDGAMDEYEVMKIASWLDGEE